MWILWVRIESSEGLRFGAKCLANNMILGTCHAHVFNHLLLQHPKTNKKNSRTTSACNTINKQLVTFHPCFLSKLTLKKRFWKSCLAFYIHSDHPPSFSQLIPTLEPKMRSETLVTVYCARWHTQGAKLYIHRNSPTWNSPTEFFFFALLVHYISRWET